MSAKRIGVRESRHGRAEHDLALRNPQSSITRTMIRHSNLGLHDITGFLPWNDKSGMTSRNGPNSV